MGDDGVENIRVAVYPEIETPRAGYPRLPYAALLVIPFGAERRMPEVTEQITELLGKSPLDLWGRRLKPLLEPMRGNRAHVPVISRHDASRA